MMLNLYFRYHLKKLLDCSTFFTVLCLGRGLAVWILLQYKSSMILIINDWSCPNKVNLCSWESLGCFSLSPWKYSVCISSSPWKHLRCFSLSPWEHSVCISFSSWEHSGCFSLNIWGAMHVYQRQWRQYQYCKIDGKCCQNGAFWSSV